MHRLHGDDLAGHVLAQEDWDVVRLPAIAEADELHRVETVFGRQCFGRKAGEALQPEREPPEMLAQLRRTLGEYNFAGQYQQAPSPQGGGMIKADGSGAMRRMSGRRSSTGSCRAGTPPTRPESSAILACARAGASRARIFILHVLRRRMEYPELKRAVCEQCQAFEASVVLIEDRPRAPS